MVQIISIQEGSSESFPQHQSISCPCTNQEQILTGGTEVKLDAGKEMEQNFILQYSGLKDYGTISGIVKNKNGQLICNAIVKVFDIHHNPITQVFTNQEGQYLIYLPPGSYILKATSDNW